jgi:hypothetical protein
MRLLRAGPDDVALGTVAKRMVTGSALFPHNPRFNKYQSI